MSYRIIKPMEYQSSRKIELLYDAPYRGYHFYILSLGTHPTAYVEIPKDHKFYKKNYNDIDDKIIVHGGLTYSRDYLSIDKNIKIEDSWFIGWDYAHYDDYFCYIGHLGNFGKKWTTKEMIAECKNVINQLCEVE